MQWCSYPFSTNNRWEDLTAVLEADVESPIGGHPRNEGDKDADLGQNNRNVDKVLSKKSKTSSLCDKSSK